MTHFTPVRLRLRSIALVTAVLLPLTGCFSWRSERGLQGPDLAGRKELRLILTDSSRVELWYTVLVADTIIGFDRQQVHRISLDRIARVERRRLDVRRTALITLGITTVAAAIVIAASSIDFSDCLFVCQ